MSNYLQGLMSSFNQIRSVFDQKEQQSAMQGQQKMMMNAQPENTQPEQQMGPPSPANNVQIGKPILQGPSTRVQIGKPTLQGPPMPETSIEGLTFDRQAGPPTPPVYENEIAYQGRQGQMGRPSDAVESSTIQPLELLADAPMIAHGLVHGGKAAVMGVKALKTYLEGKAAQKELSQILKSSGLREALKDFKPMSNPPEGIKVAAPVAPPMRQAASEMVTKKFGIPNRGGDTNILDLLKSLHPEGK